MSGIESTGTEPSGWERTSVFAGEPVAVALAGQAAGLYAARKTSPAVGALALAGVDVSVRAARRTSPAVAALALSGPSTSLLFGHYLAGGQGAQALAGQAAGLRATRLLSPATTALSLGGVAASILATRRLVAEPGPRAFIDEGSTGTEPTGWINVDGGTFHLAGQVAALLFGHKVQAATGALALAGIDVGIRAARRTVPATAALVLAGSPAALLFGHYLGAGLGTLALAGPAIGLRATRLLPIATATLTLDGIAASILATRRMSADLGAHALAGPAIGLRATRLLTIDTAAVTLDGIAASIRATRYLFPAVGPLTLAGQAASIRADRLLFPAAGTIVLDGQPALYFVTAPGVETLEDLEAFFDEDEFAAVAVWSRGDVVMRTGLVGNFDRPATDDRLGGQVPFTASNPVFLCPAHVVQGIRQGDGITVRGAELRVRELRPDGTGLMRLHLEAAA